MPSMGALKAFAVVAETLSFSAAGRALNVTHAAVSQQVRSLESHLGMTLVVRQGRGLELTPEGEELAKGLARGFAEIQDCVTNLSRLGSSRALQVSPTPTFAAHWLMARIPDFKQQHPDVELVVNPTAQVVQLEPGGVDVAIRFGDGNWPGVESELLMPTNYVVVGCTSLVGEDTHYEPEDLQDLPWLQEVGTNELALWMERQGIKPRNNLNVTHMPGYMVMDSLRRGMGITAMGELFVDAEIKAGTMRILFKDLRDKASGYHLVTRPGVQRPPLRTFCNWIKRKAREGNLQPTE